MKIKAILNIGEEIVFDLINKQLKKHNARVFPKVRLADVFEISKRDIENGLYTNKEYTFALKSHFDFVVGNKEYLPLFAIESDGKSHNEEGQKALDNIKDKLCEIANFPILRIYDFNYSTKHLEENYRGYSILNYCIDLWFARESFFNAQQQNIIPKDEIFIPWGLYDSSEKMPFHLNLKVDILAKMSEFYKKGLINQPRPSVIVYYDKNEKMYLGIIWFPINNENIIFLESRVKVKLFPILESELLYNILFTELFVEIEKFVQGKKIKQVNISEFKEKLELYKTNTNYEWRGTSGYKRS